MKKKQLLRKGRCQPTHITGFPKIAGNFEIVFSLKQNLMKKSLLNLCTCKKQKVRKSFN